MDNNETNVREQHSTEAQQAAAEARAKARNTDSYGDGGCV